MIKKWVASNKYSDKEQSHIAHCKEDNRMSKTWYILFPFLRPVFFPSTIWSLIFCHVMWTYFPSLARRLSFLSIPFILLLRHTPWLCQVILPHFRTITKRNQTSQQPFLLWQWTRAHSHVGQLKDKLSANIQISRRLRYRAHFCMYIGKWWHCKPC